MNALQSIIAKTIVKTSITLLTSHDNIIKTCSMRINAHIQVSRLKDGDKKRLCNYLVEAVACIVCR